jgi:spore germination cell wall hydrolase CwlJ-like protein
MSIELAKLEPVSESLLTNVLTKIFFVVLMSLSVIGAGSLLNWAVNNRLANVESVEASAVTMEMRERQLTCLARNIYYEAGGEPFEGKVAVAQVTLNRANNSQFPSDICEVIYQKNKVYEKVICQFSWVCNRPSGLKPNNSPVWEESMSVAKKVLLEGFRLPSLTNALYFHADYINPGWNRKQVAKIGRHIFYQ